MLGRFVGRVAAATALVFAISTPAIAAVIIDQSALVPTPPALGRVVLTMGNRAPAPGSTAPALINARVGQSVTAGVNGILSGIEVQGPFWSGPAGSDNFFRMSLFSGDLGGANTLVGSMDVPVFAVLNSGSLNSAATFFVDVSSLGFAVRPGSMFSFTAELLGPPTLFALVTIGNVSGSPRAPVFEFNNYAGGSAYFSNNGSAYAAIPRDVGFRTFVDEVSVPAVPEPATWAMMLLGFGAVGYSVRSKTASRVAA